MNKTEAYKILESSPGTSEEDLKKKYRDLVKKYHPDVYKDDPNKLKTINEAYDVIKNGDKRPGFTRTNINADSIPPEVYDEIFSNFAGFSGFRQTKSSPSRNASNIFTETEVSFEESVLGTSKEIEIDREIKCAACGGEGFKAKKNNCTHCDGFGRSVTQGNGVYFATNCAFCIGQSTKEECTACEKKTFTKTKTKLKVQIPAGVSEDNTINLQGAGNYAHSSIFGDVYSNVLIRIKVKNETDLTLEGRDVKYVLELSLLESLTGCSKTVPTIQGETEISVPPGTRNNEEIVIPSLGVGKAGNQRVIFDVRYPDNKEKLISALEE